MSESVIAAIYGMLILAIFIQHWHHKAVKGERDRVSYGYGTLMDEKKKLESEIHRLVQQSVEKQGMLEAEIEVRQAAQDALCGTQTELRGALAMLNDVTEKYERSREQLTGISRELSTVRDERNSLQSRVKELETECAQWQKMAQDVGDEASGYHMAAVNLRTTLHSLRDRIDTELEKRLEPVEERKTGKQEITSIGTISLESGITLTSLETTGTVAVGPYGRTHSTIKPSP